LQIRAIGVHEFSHVNDNLFHQSRNLSNESERIGYVTEWRLANYSLRTGTDSRGFYENAVWDYIIRNQSWYDGDLSKNPYPYK